MGSVFEFGIYFMFKMHSCSESFKSVNSVRKIDLFELLAFLNCDFTRFERYFDSVLLFVRRGQV